jgi:hypothetical protein
MLENSTYRKFIEHDWVHIWNNESNPSQFWHRIRTQANRAINQLIKLANKLPDEKQQEIFNYSDMKKFIISILEKGNYADPMDELSDARRTQLAALLVEEGIKVCIKKYELLHNETRTLTEPTTIHLNKAKDICKEIAYIVDLNQRKLAAEQEKLIHLFNWNRIPGSDNEKLIKFMKAEFGEFDDKWVRAIKKQDHGNTIFFSFRNFPKEKSASVFYIKMGNDRKSATVYNYDPDDDEEQVNNNKVQKSLIVKSEYDNLNVYKNKK